MAKWWRPASPTRCWTIRTKPTPSCSCHPFYRREALMSEILKLDRVAKTFVMHLQDGVRLPVVKNVSFSVNAGECIVLSGPSGAGKSSLLKMIFGTYRCDHGVITIRHSGASVDIAAARPRE